MSDDSMMVASPRRRLVAVGVACVILMLAVMAVGHRTGARQQVRATADDAPATSLRSTTSTTTTSTSATVIETTAPSVSIAPQTTATTEVAIVNHPLRITLTADRTDVAPGETVTVTATISDDDAQPREHCVSWSAEANHTGRTPVRFGDGTEPCVPIDQQMCPAGAAPTEGGTGSDSFHYSNYGFDGTEPSEFVVYVFAYSSDPECIYASSAEASITLAMLPGTAPPGFSPPPEG